MRLGMSDKLPMKNNVDARIAGAFRSVSTSASLNDTSQSREKHL